MSFFKVRQIKSSRKRCCCYWCGDAVNIGDSKTTTATVWEGDFQSSNFHPECYDALERWQNLPENKWSDEWPAPIHMKRGEITEL